MEAVSNLVNNVSNLVANVSNFSQPFDENREERASVVIGGNEAMLIEFNAALLADFRHVERTLFALQRNLDDFYFVTLTAITFGRIFVFTVWLFLRLLLLVSCFTWSHAMRFRVHGSRSRQDEEHDQHSAEGHHRRL